MSSAENIRIIQGQKQFKQWMFPPQGMTLVLTFMTCAMVMFTDIYKHTSQITLHFYGLNIVSVAFLGINGKSSKSLNINSLIKLKQVSMEKLWLDQLFFAWFTEVSCYCFDFLYNHSLLTNFSKDSSHLCSWHSCPQQWRDRNHLRWRLGLRLKESSPVPASGASTSVMQTSQRTGRRNQKSTVHLHWD